MQYAEPNDRTTKEIEWAGIGGHPIPPDLFHCFRLDLKAQHTCYRVYDLLRSTNTFKRSSAEELLQEYLSGIRIDRTSITWMYDVLSTGLKDVLKNLRLKLPKLTKFLAPRNVVLHPERHII